MELNDVDSLIIAIRVRNDDSSGDFYAFKKEYESLKADLWSLFDFHLDISDYIDDDDEFY